MTPETRCAKSGDARIAYQVTGNGPMVHIGARVAAIANSGEVLVSGTVRDLVAGSGLRFADRGSLVLKGVPGEWRIFALGD